MNEQVAQLGRPRSEQAREAVLHAVDDLLLEVGYAAMTMKGIAERAGVGRQTVYRWWSTKAEILFEASALDAEQDLVVSPKSTAMSEIAAYLDALRAFLVGSPAGLAYRALVAAAQQDDDVAKLIASRDVIGDSARVVLRRVLDDRVSTATLDDATAALVGPTFFWIMTGHDPARLRPRRLAQSFLREFVDTLPARESDSVR